MPMIIDVWVSYKLQVTDNSLVCVISIKTIVTARSTKGTFIRHQAMVNNKQKYIQQKGTPNSNTLQIFALDIAELYIFNLATQY